MRTHKLHIRVCVSYTTYSRWPDMDNVREKVTHSNVMSNDLRSSNKSLQWGKVTLQYILTALVGHSSNWVHVHVHMCELILPTYILCIGELLLSIKSHDLDYLSSISVALQI